MTTDPIEYLRSLSDEQGVAARLTDDPLMIIACAGSGKTRTLIGRFIHLMLPREMGGLGADPNSIMMVTFTNKAAREMRERIKPVIDTLRERYPSIHGEPWIGTFHGLSLRILRVEAARAGLGPNFSIFDESDAQSLAKDVADQLEMGHFDVDGFFRDLEMAKSRMLSAELLSQKAFEIFKARQDGPVLPRGLATWEKILSRFETDNFQRVYTAYQASLDEQNAVDFSDLMNRVTRLFQESDEVRSAWRSTFRHFMIDEFQDTNRAQVAWLDAFTDGGREMLLPEGTYDNAMAEAGHGMHEINGYRVRQFPRPTVAFVGDDDQSIYAFRGSDPSIVKLLSDRYPGMQQAFLRQSYRCQPAILDVANTLVSRNRGRFNKVIEAADPTRARSTVIVEEHTSPADEIRRLCADASSHIASGQDPSTFAVLTRTRDLAKAVAKEMRAFGLPVTEGKASDIRKTAEVRDAMAFAGFISNPEAEVFLRRIINKPSRGLGTTSMGRVGANARKKNISFLEEVRSILYDRIDLPDDAEPYKSGFIGKLKDFGHLVAEMRKASAAARNAGKAIEAILEVSGYMHEKKMDALSAAGVKERTEFLHLSPREFLAELISVASEGKETIDESISSEDLADRAGQMSEASRRLGNLALLLEQAERHEKLDDFMQEATLEMDRSEQAAGIQVMTVHASKGLEFSKVRLPFWMEGLFPHSRALDEGDDAIEEERRLAYVALTRAIDDVRISRSWKLGGCQFIRGPNNRPSRFISEMMASPNGAFKMTSVKGANHAAYKVSKTQRPGALEAPAKTRESAPVRQTLADALGIVPRSEAVPSRASSPVVAPRAAARPVPDPQDSFFDRGFGHDDREQIGCDEVPRPEMTDAEYERMYADGPDYDLDADFEPSF